MNDAALGNAMKSLRAEAGLTQAELALQVGVTRKTINTVENGVFIPSALLALKIARALGQKVENVFWIQDESDNS
ncbi:helix-turn-helix transcriptional regulator [Oceanicaulis alexandrii]|uniref:helix-turn-helix transcriptional regulator n=1 Tax=Oceanicaulis alexandrii TaxID=153233 RepID=UPI0003B3AD83|nr:helix-turn-helix transcriptional regulator [Oceanicaulis alexandrii]|tara:strand:- start:901 stop:1125 length:225 start_codon:yes stop_codon:yes gene_type:complete